MPESLCSSTRLGHLNLYDNRLGFSIPPCITTAFVSLSSIMLQNNKLEGPIPTHWHLPNLHTVALSSNHRLRGEMHDSWFGGCPMMRNLIIEGTQLKGSLPDTVYSSQYLSTLSLSGNRLSGPIPARITQLGHLRILRLRSNFIEGYVPELIGNLTTLIILDLSDNNIRGTVPSSFG